MTLNLSYAEPAYIPACPCGKHALHLLYSHFWQYPGLFGTRGGLVRAAKDLHANYGTLKKTAFRLRRLPDISKRCPECFSPSLEGLTCRNCGVELDAPKLPEGIRFEETSPVHSIQSGNGLGSKTDYQSLHLQYGALNVQHLIERPEDSFIEACKSKLWQELKETMPSDGVTEEASKMLLKEIADFRTRYPGLVRAKGASDQLVQNVVSRLALRYPALRKNGGIVA